MTSPEEQPPLAGITVVAFDADDTLWHHHDLFVEALERFSHLQTICEPEQFRTRVDECEVRNIPIYGYGVRSFVLSLIETVVRGFAERPEATDVALLQAIVEQGKAMQSDDVRLMEQAAEVLDTLLARGYDTWLITKGDRFAQASKLDRSGLSKSFSRVHIVEQKNTHTYARILHEAKVGPTSFCMVGNSPSSDINPVIAVGGRAVHIPYVSEWIHEHSPLPSAHEGFRTVASLRDLLGILPGREH